MATSRLSPWDVDSFPAGSASLAQYQFCALNASGQLITPASAGVFAVVLDDAPSLAVSTDVNGLFSGGYTVGAFYTVALSGQPKVIAGAALAAGVPVKTDTSGHAVAATTGGDVILGWTLKACQSGSLVRVLLERSIHN